VNQIDLLVVMTKAGDPSCHGGIVWLREMVSEQWIPVILIPLDDPRRAELKWTVRGQRSQQSLFPNDSAQLDSGIIHGLHEGIVTTSAKAMERA
jgi:hypothetical protein